MGYRCSVCHEQISGQSTRVGLQCFLGRHESDLVNNLHMKRAVVLDSLLDPCSHVGNILGPLGRDEVSIKKAF